MQVNIKYRNKIRQEIYYIKKFGLISHLKKCDINIDSIKYLNILYGKILYVLQINEKDEEFKKKIVKNYTSKINEAKKY